MESREHPLQHWTPDVVLNRSVMSDSSCDPVDCSPPGKNTGVAMPSSRGSSQPRDWTQGSRIAGRFFTLWATMEARDSICQTLERHANYREMSCNRDRVESSLRVGDFLLPSFELEVWLWHGHRSLSSPCVDLLNFCRFLLIPCKPSRLSVFQGVQSPKWWEAWSSMKLWHQG